MKPTIRFPKNKIFLFQRKILSWFNDYGRHHFPWRKESLSTYEIVIAEVLLQRTKAETIAKFYEGFLHAFPNWDTIANVEISILEKQLQPIGLYRQRAKRLKELAIEMNKRKGIFPPERHELAEIPFLGQYIVNAIELQVFGKPSPLLDVNMARVLERYFGERQLADIRYDPYLQQLASEVVDHKQSKEISWAILDFASAICQARRPRCEVCSLSSTCLFHKKTLNDLFLP